MKDRRHHETAAPRGFTLTELLVVVALIALLAGLLLVALARVQEARKRGQTLATMQSFLSACNAFRAEHGHPPGLVPERILAFHNHNIAHKYPGTAVSSTENALLHLLGGYVLKDEVPLDEWVELDQGWIAFSVLRPGNEPPLEFKVNPGLIGQGPVIDGKPYPPYLDLDALSIGVVDFESGIGQWGCDANEKAPDSVRCKGLPELIDAWGNAILYVRRVREFGPMGGDAHGEVIGAEGIKPRFIVDSLWPYTRAPRQMWQDPARGGDGRGSILSTYDPSDYDAGGFDSYLTHSGLAQIVRHPGIGVGADPSDPLQAQTALGDVVLISAGPDGIYYSAVDGPGSTSAPIGSGDYPYQRLIRADPSIIDEFDDLRLGG